MAPSTAVKQGEMGGDGMIVKGNGNGGVVWHMAIASGAVFHHFDIADVLVGDGGFYNIAGRKFAGEWQRAGNGWEYMGSVLVERG